MKLRPDKPSADQPRSVVAIGDNWRVKRNSLALKYHQQLFRGRQHGLEVWEDVAVETHRDDIIVAMKRHHLLDTETNAMVSKLPAWVGAGVGRDSDTKNSSQPAISLRNSPDTGARSANSLRPSTNSCLPPSAIASVNRPIQPETRRASQ